MKMEVLIYQPEKTAMQSGTFKSQHWFMKFMNYDKENTKYLFDLMNWAGSMDTLLTVKIPFGSKEEAINFANLKGFKYQILENNKRMLKKKSYTSNFI